MTTDPDDLPPGVLPLNYHRTWNRPPNAPPPPTPATERLEVRRGRTAPYVQVPHLLLDHTSSGLSHAAVRVWLVLASYANGDGTAWPGLRTVAAKGGVSRSTVIRALDDLEAAGWIDRQRRYGEGGEARSTLYTVHYTPAPS